MKLPVYVGRARRDAKPGEPATVEIARFATTQEAEHFLATSPLIDPDLLAAGDYCIEAPETDFDEFHGREYGHLPHFHVEQPTYVTWKAQVDAIAARYHLEPNGADLVWRRHYDAGLTPQQAWDATPWRRNP